MREIPRPEDVVQTIGPPIALASRSSPRGLITSDRDAGELDFFGQGVRFVTVYIQISCDYLAFRRQIRRNGREIIPLYLLDWLCYCTDVRIGLWE